MVSIFLLLSHDNDERNIDAIKNCNWQKRQLFFLIFVILCGSIWGLSSSSPDRCSEGADGNPRGHWFGKMKRGRKCVFFLFSFIKPKDQSIKGWIKPQRRQTEGDFSISSEKGKAKSLSWKQKSSLWAWSLNFY